MSKVTSRRKFLKLMAGSSAIGMLAACATPTAAPSGGALDVQATATTEPPPEPTVAPTSTPAVYGQGNLELTMWMQDFGPIVGNFEKAAEQFSKTQGNVKINVQPLPYNDLQAKVIPAVAGGNEAEVMMGYTNWYVATDISKLFLPLDDFFGGRSELEKVVFPSALTTLDTPQNKIYYLPYLTGMNGASTTLNAGQYEEVKLDYTSFKTFEDFHSAAKTLTLTEGDSIKRAGMSIWAHILTVIKSWIWQMGGEFYNRETGEWTLATPEGEAALKKIYDLYQTDKLSSIDIGTREYEAFLQGALSTHLMGAWTLGVAATSNPELKLDCVPTPKLQDAESDVVYPDHTAVVTLSRRLGQDQQKLDAAVGLTRALLSADALIEIMNQYSGSLMSTALYQDPRLEKTKFGPISKRVAESVWARAKFPQDHVANQAPALTELQRAVQKEISITEALQNADKYLNEQEAQARERLKS